MYAGNAANPFESTSHGLTVSREESMKPGRAARPAVEARAPGRRPLDAEWLGRAPLGGGERTGARLSSRIGATRCSTVVQSAPSPESKTRWPNVRPPSADSITPLSMCRMSPTRSSRR